LEWVVTTGRTVEEALETALDQLGVDEQDAEVEVLQEPQRGLFGRVRVEAQVRARVRPSPPPPKVDRRERRRRDRGRRDGERPRTRAKSGSGGRGSGSGSGAGGSAGSSSGSGSGGSRGAGSGSAKGGRGGGRTAAAETKAEARVGAGVNGSDGGPGDRSDHQDRPDGGSGSGQGGGEPRKRRRRRTRGAGAGGEEGASVVSESTTTDVDETFDIEAQREAVDEFIRGLLESFGRPDASISVTVVEEDTLEAAIDGSELGLLVGQKGTTLQSLQELVRSMVQRRFVGQAHARVRVDVAGYRERRRAALERFTEGVADTVRESGVAKALDPMGPADRKVIHDTVNELDGVETVSEGEDADRHVVIRPAS
jgi:spoIIIJ-associated protein